MTSPASVKAKLRRLAAAENEPFRINGCNCMVMCFAADYNDEDQNR